MKGEPRPLPPRRPMWPRSGRGPLPEEPALPTLAAVLDPEEMAGRIRRLHPVWAGIESVELGYLRYKPGLSCVLTWEVEVGGESRLLVGRLTPPSEFAVRLEKTRAVVRSSEEEAPAVYGMEDLGLVLTVFPHDRSVRGAKFLLDPGKLKRCLQERVKGFEPERRIVKAKRMRLWVQSYKPERRCLVRLGVGFRDQEDQGNRRWEEIYARAYADEAGHDVHEALTSLVGDPVFGGAFPGPGSRGYVGEERVLFLDKLPGASLLEKDTPGDWVGSAREAGAFLARLHRARWRGGRDHDLDRLLAEIAETVDLLADRVGETASILGRRLDGLRRTRPEESGPHVLLHGDFHPAQLLMQEGRCSVVDFDEVGTGPAALDLGYYLGHLPLLVRRKFLSQGQAGKMVGAFLEGYEKAGGTPPPRDVLEWHRRLTLLRLALNSVKHLHEDWPEAARHYLEAAWT